MRLALALALVACTTTRTAEQHAEVGLETHAEQKAEEHRELHGTDQTFTHTIRTAERFTPDGGVAARVVTDTSTGIDRSFVASAIGTSGAEQQTTLKAASEAHSSLTRSWWPPAWLLACLALGAAIALWAARRKLAAGLTILRGLF